MVYYKFIIACVYKNIIFCSKFFINSLVQLYNATVWLDFIETFKLSLTTFQNIYDSWKSSYISIVKAVSVVISYFKMKLFVLLKLIFKVLSFRNKSMYKNPKLDAK